MDLATIDRAGAKRALVSWTLGADGNVSTPVATLHARAAVAAAADGVADLTVDELVLATVINSEDGNAPPATLVAIGDATLNRAGRGSVLDEATGGHGFGKQGNGRPMSTARPPQLRHLRAAIALTRGDARGYSLGATMWIHWRTQNDQAKKFPKKACPARAVIEGWCWGSTWANRAACQRGERRGPTMEWIGKLAGVDERRLLMFRRATAHHAERWSEVLAIIEPARPSPVGLALAGALVLAGGV